MTNMIADDFLAINKRLAELERVTTEAPIPKLGCPQCRDRGWMYRHPNGDHSLEPAFAGRILLADAIVECPFCGGWRATKPGACEGVAARQAYQRPLTNQEYDYEAYRR